MSDWRVIEGVVTRLGEGLHWDQRRGCLWMVDIQGGQLIRAVDAAGGAPLVWAAPERIGWVIPYAGAEALLVGLQSGFARLAQPLPAAGSALQVQMLHRPFGTNTALRLNDAKADSSGAVWAGSLNNNDESRSEGALFRLATDGTVQQVDSDYQVANGPAISADERLMLHTDSARRTIYAFDLDVKAGRLANKRVWRRFTEEEGYPDGMCFDADGAVWVAHWGGACVSRFDAEGRLLRRLTLPTRHITNVCFGGERLDRLYVSSARAGHSAAQLAQLPLAGALFVIDSPGTTGLPGGQYRGT
jgi:sugar lactone lactonase YvrE